MKVVYVAGPFRHPTHWGMAENIRAAERVGVMIAMADAMPLIPHANTAHFHGLRNTKFWLDGTLELLRRCDGAVFIPGWPDSDGSCGEWDECERLQKPRLDLNTLPWRDEMSSAIAAFVSVL